ncbi:carboxymuconolactone decarboxylase family protein [Terrarubrum flagellatum]|uniref:carboxymuconolactone decarboxylase family protein n=1 Tax=Terrirubrum flagellatum TaxID=2895980 RepID=UPI00314524FC
MKATTAIALATSMNASIASAQTVGLTRHELQAVAPALDRYGEEKLVEGLWKRPDLSPRDRSLVTVATVIARDQQVLMARQLLLALDNGVTPAEISETITHLAFYAGWANAMSAAVAAKSVFESRSIIASQLPLASPTLLPLDEKSETDRATRVAEGTGPASQGLVRDTADILFRDLWLRPDLKPRDRSLVTVSALVAAGRVEQIPYHLNRAMDNGLTRQEASEALSHLAYYAGWPNAFSAAPIFRSVFQKRHPN